MTVYSRIYILIRMGRPARHAEAKILECARQISAQTGPRSLTIAAVAERAGAPVGSIYYRHASRDEILATIWLDLVEAFQHSFLAPLENEVDPVEAGLAAVTFTCTWVRSHPVEARLLLIHRREDFAADRWSARHRERA
ncbi:MAG: TetR/AcrR family transcriptional regulator, partial [Deltaproteobacteria bacterium]|nr:TetR/AcrR family transcriptional regulator [Deltaproteobacteria bacterium]